MTTELTPGISAQPAGEPSAYSAANCMSGIPSAIVNRRLLSFHYNEYLRIAEPYIYGIGLDGKELLYAYEASVGCVLGEPAGWWTFEICRVRGLRVLNDRFSQWREGASRGEGLFAEVRVRLWYPQTDALGMPTATHRESAGSPVFA